MKTNSKDVLDLSQNTYNIIWVRILLFFSGHVIGAVFRTNKPGALKSGSRKKWLIQFFFSEKRSRKLLPRGNF